MAHADPLRLEDARAAHRLGRAFGTLLRRRTGGGPQKVVLARGADGPERAARDGLAGGLVLAGHEVLDLGVAPDAELAFAVAHLGAAGGVWVAPGGASLWLGRRPLAGDALAELEQLAAGDEHAAGEGSLRFVDVRAAFLRADLPAGDA